MQLVKTVKNAECYFEKLRMALDVVAREKKFLAFTEAPSKEIAYDFYRNIISNDLCQLLLIADEQILGCCDILPNTGQTRAHVGTLGLWLIPEARGQKMGSKLIDETIAWGWQKGFARIELAVREDNLPARRLYEKKGFQHEGICLRDFLVDGQYYHSCMMALLK